MQNGLADVVATIVDEGVGDIVAVVGDGFVATVVVGGDDDNGGVVASWLLVEFERHSV